MVKTIWKTSPPSRDEAGVVRIEAFEGRAHQIFVDLNARGHHGGQELTVTHFVVIAGIQGAEDLPALRNKELERHNKMPKRNIQNAQNKDMNWHEKMWFLKTHLLSLNWRMAPGFLIGDVEAILQHSSEFMELDGAFFVLVQFLSALLMLSATLMPSAMKDCNMAIRHEIGELIGCMNVCEPEHVVGSQSFFPNA